VPEEKKSWKSWDHPLKVEKQLYIKVVTDGRVF
jgi:hypothetical protein